MLTKESNVCDLLFASVNIKFVKTHDQLEKSWLYWDKRQNKNDIFFLVLLGFCFALRPR